MREGENTERERRTVTERVSERETGRRGRMRRRRVVLRSCVGRVVKH